MSPTAETPLSIARAERVTRTLNVKQTEPIEAAWQIMVIAVTEIGPSPYQPRIAFDEADMDELIESVKQRGVQQPVIIRTAKPVSIISTQKNANGKSTASDKSANRLASTNGARSESANPLPNGKAVPQFRYELVAGERRLLACKAAKKRWIPAIIRDDLTDAQAAELALLENVQRSNLTCIEEARGYKRLMLDFRMKEERIAKKVGKSVGTIIDVMKLLQLPESVQVLLFEKKLTASHGYELLPLAPFEKLCALVSSRIVKDKLTAASLQSNPLPNVKELKAQGLLVELDYKTKFNWQNECGKCPLKAYVRSGYSSYCLKPDEWEKKQVAALATQQEEAARVMEQARQDNSGIVEVDHLPAGSYKDLSYGDPPAGCSPQCPCYKETVDPHDPTKKRPVCLDPNRFKGLLQAEREAEEHKRNVHFNALWESAKDILLADVESGELRRITVLLAEPILRSMYDENGYIESWREGVEQIAEELDVPMLDDFLSAGDESEACAMLDQRLQDGCPPLKVLLLCVLMLLANEARTAIRFIQETPGLDYVNGHDAESKASSQQMEWDAEVTPVAEVTGVK